MAQTLVNRHRHAAGEVEGPHTGVGMGDFEALRIPDLLMQPGRSTGGFASEHKAVTGGEGSIPMGAFRLGGEEPEADGPIRGGPESRPIIMVPDIEMIPVIHSAPLEMAIGDRKSQRMDQMENTIGDGAKPPDISRILGNFRLKKDHVKRSLGTHWEA